MAGEETSESLPTAWKDEIRDLVKGVVQEVTGRANDDTRIRRAGGSLVERRLDADSEIEAKIEAGIAKLRAKDEEDLRKVEHENRLKQVEDKVKVKERSPVERRRVHKFMGYGEPSE